MTESIATITNNGPDENLDRFGVARPDDEFSTVEGWDHADRDELLTDVAFGDRVRQSTWRDEFLDDDEAVVIAVVEARDAYWTIWADAGGFVADAWPTRTDAESQYEAWMTKRDWLDYGPPTATDMAGIEVIPDGHKSIRNDDGDIEVVPI